MLIECDDLEENLEEEEERILLEPKVSLQNKGPELSLHVMEGSPPITIRIMGLIHNKVSIILDSGSTHNFVNPRVVQRTGLQVLTEPSFTVTIA